MVKAGEGAHYNDFRRYVAQIEVRFWMGRARSGHQLAKERRHAVEWTGETESRSSPDLEELRMQKTSAGSNKYSANEYGQEYSGHSRGFSIVLGRRGADQPDF